MAVSDPAKPGHCPGKILVNCGYCLRKEIIVVMLSLHCKKV